MNHTSKVCDAADWFRPEIHEIITGELREVPRFHRKQWEFASIFLALRQLGKLHPDKLGLSMGGGKELLLYAVAPHVRELIVTDLYATDTTWDCARTEDPDAFVKFNKPLPVEDSKIRALRMDMKQLEFPDGAFDFCYSTCAVEHIGGRSDFLRHLNEVARVLKDDGIYVMTTEVLYGDTTIPDEHNYVFSLSYLDDLFAESLLMPEQEFDARIALHKINYPLPSNISNLASGGERDFGEHYLGDAPHLHLLRGSHPFTAGLFFLRKRAPRDNSGRVRIVGLKETQEFMQTGVDNYRNLLAASTVSVNPFSSLPRGVSWCFTDHAKFFGQERTPFDRETIFHTDYFWWGTVRREFVVSLTPSAGTDEMDIELRVHRYRTLSSRNVECVYEERLHHAGSERLVHTFSLETDEDSCYALLARRVGHTCAFDKITIKSSLADLVKKNFVLPDQRQEPIPSAC